MPAFDDLKPFSFAAIAFPYTTYEIVGGLRDKIHEYPHSPGGAAEKLGRKLYETTVRAEFVANPLSAKYKTLWPAALGALRALWEKQATRDLHVPSIGTFQAYCRTWKESAVNTKRNAVTVEMTFVEDQNQAFLVNSLVEIDSAGMQNQIDNFTAAIAEALVKDPASTDLFDGIVQTANALLAIKDQIDLYGSAVAAKIETLALLCDQADRQVNEMDSLEFQNVRDALHDLWLSATTLKKDVETKLVKLKTFTTPIQMTINAAARAVGIENPADMLQLNAIQDPLNIPANTNLRYYDPAA